MTDKEIEEYNARVEFREWWEIQAVKLINAATRPVYVGIWILFILDCLLGAFVLTQFTALGASTWGAVLIGALVHFGVAAFLLWAALLVLSLVYWLRFRAML